MNGVALRHYIDFFDFAGLRLDLAFRYVVFVLRVPTMFDCL